jgi:hypothetical protein
MQAHDLDSYFHSIKLESDLQRMIVDSVKEDLYLEFKQKHDTRHGKLDDDDKSNFSCALSGFANSDGGILIWGIETNRKDESAKKLKPISDVNEFIRSLKSSLINAVQPFVDNVLIEKVPTDASQQEGYVKCFIPQSDKAPHRAMLADREYYKRSTEGFYRLEHFDLEDMFGRRQRPLLKLMITSGDYPEDDPDVRQISFAFINEGRALARYYSFLCKFDENIEIVGNPDGNIEDVTRLNNGRLTIGYTDNVGVIHPNNITYNMGGIRYKRKDKSKRIYGHVVYICDKMTRKSVDFEIE